MLKYLKVPFVALITLGAVAAASAAPVKAIHNERGTFVQDGAGVWHQYSRVQRDVLPPVDTTEVLFDRAKGNID
jgi:hypothetical protein